MTPNGVSSARPPALTTPPAVVWQTMQSPSAASCWPRATVAAENTEGSGRAIGAIARHGIAAVPTAIAVAQTAASPANTPGRTANGFFHVFAGDTDCGEGNMVGVSGASPRSPRRMRSGVKGGSRKRTPVASKIAFAIAAALGTEADSPTPSGGWSCRGSISTSIFGTSGNLMMGYAPHSRAATVVRSNGTSSISARLVDWITLPSIWWRTPSGLIIRPESWPATTRVTLTSPVALLTATSAIQADHAAP